MAGPLKTLFGALAASTYLTGVSLVYGEEEVHDASKTLPMVTLVPTGGPFEASPGYSANLAQDTEAQWAVVESVDLYLWAADPSPTATPIDHTDATESLRQLVLSALQDQRAQYTDVANVSHGLFYKPVSQRWQLMQGGFTRYGRALVLTVAILIPIAIAPPEEAVITSVLKTVVINPGAPT
jgi:hypothetical protein